MDFASESEAITYMLEDYPSAGNVRFAFFSDDEAREWYNVLSNRPGSPHDVIVTVNGEKAMVGCTNEHDTERASSEPTSSTSGRTSSRKGKV